MKKFIMLYYNLKHEIYTKLERDYNPKTDSEGIQHFCGGYVKKIIVCVKRPQKYKLYTPQCVCNKERRVFPDEEVLF